MGAINLGISKIEFANVPANGSMATDTALKPLGYTVEDSTSLNQEDGNRKDYNVEELDVPFDTSESGGKMTLSFTIADPDVDTLVKVFGGEKDATTGNYKAPDTKVTIEQAMKVTPKKGMGFIVPRTGITAKFTNSMGKNNYLGIEVVAEFKKSIKADVPIYEVFMVN